MSILVTGSLALDHIMVFPDRFRNHILPDKIHILNVSFNVPSLQTNFGGTAGNIAYHLRLLEEEPILLGTVGSDFGAYFEWLKQHGIRSDAIRVLSDARTAQAFITTDLDDNQITAFHAGAMNRAHEAALDDVDEALEAAVVAANGKRAMQEHARGLKARGVPTLIDPGQGLPLFDRDELLELLDGAAVYVVNDYEWSLTLERTGLGEQALAKRVGVIVVTRGEHGSTLHQGEQRVEVPAVPARKVVDPTGCGDAYRAGLLYAVRRGLAIETGARLGSLLGSLAVEEQGTQSVVTDLPSLRARYEAAFGEPL